MMGYITDYRQNQSRRIIVIVCGCFRTKEIKQSPSLLSHGTFYKRDQKRSRGNSVKRAPLLNPSACGIKRQKTYIVQVGGVKWNCLVFLNNIPEHRGLTAYRWLLED